MAERFWHSLERIYEELKRQCHNSPAIWDCRLERTYEELNCSQRAKPLCRVGLFIARASP